MASGVLYRRSNYAIGLLKQNPLPTGTSHAVPLVQPDKKVVTFLIFVDFLTLQLPSHTRAPVLCMHRTTLQSKGSACT